MPGNGAIGTSPWLRISSSAASADFARRCAPRRDPMMDVVMGWEPTDPADALVVFLSSVSSTYGFTLFRNGERTRHYVYADGVAVEDEGTPLPVESEIALPSWGLDEDFLWSIITAVTGLRYDEKLQYRVYPV
ncbi:hypothetical protein AB0C07_12470 [Actinoplanes missouriensis]|uniref:hypothetical protein n=1 Tax=Actinoplanes missouriensis TaxID=1866 RepID=UPI0034079D87